MTSDIERHWDGRIRQKFLKDARAAGREDLVPKILAVTGAFLRRNVIHPVNQIAWPEPKRKVSKPKTKRARETAPAVPKDPPSLTSGKAARSGG